MGELIRADERHKAEQCWEAQLLEGLDGIETELTPADLKVIRTEALSEIEARKRGRRCSERFLRHAESGFRLLAAQPHIGAPLPMRPANWPASASGTSRASTTS